MEKTRKQIKIKLARGPIRLYLILMKNVAIYLPFGAVYCINKKAMKNKKLIKHELTHLEQHKQEGLILFVLKYIYYHFKLGYWKNPYEIGARKKAGIYNKTELLELRKSLIK